MMKRSLVALSLGTIFAASTAAADDQGFYIGANIGQSSTDTVTLSTKTATGFSLIAGYQIIKYLAVEVEWTDFGSPTLGTNANYVPPAGSSSRIDGYGVKAVGIYPINDMWSVFAKLGYAQTRWTGNVSQNKNDLTYGIGGQFNWDKHWGVNLNYDLYKATGPATLNQTATVSMPSIGVQYRFF